MSDPYLAALTNPQQALALLTQLNPWNGHNNCPAAAEAVHNYLATRGTVHPADPEDICFGYVVYGSWTRAATINAVYTAVSRGAEGNHVVMHGRRSDTDPQYTADHYCNLVKIEDAVYLVDASVSPRTVLTRLSDMAGFCAGNRFIGYAYTRQYRVEQAPNPETAGRPECRDVGQNRPSLVDRYMRD